MLRKIKLLLMSVVVTLTFLGAANAVNWPTISGYDAVADIASPGYSAIGEHNFDLVQGSFNLDERLAVLDAPLNQIKEISFEPTDSEEEGNIKKYFLKISFEDSANYEPLLIDVALKRETEEEAQVREAIQEEIDVLRNELEAKEEQIRNYEELVQQLLAKIYASEHPDAVVDPVVEVPAVEPVVEVPAADPVVEVPVVEPVVEVLAADPVVEVPAADPVLEVSAVEPVVEVPAADPVVEVPAADPVLEVPAVDPIVEVPAADPIVEVPAADPVVEVPVIEQVAEVPAVEAVVEVPVIEQVAEVPAADPVVEVPAADPVVDEAPVVAPVVDEAPVVAPVVDEAPVVAPVV
ncbi:MAG: hypothetical protein Q8L85_02905, partial [Alphaproteobacteria bacterium]|nr:hypothetical protein [Alphaproteobacteria bacterium]